MRKFSNETRARARVVAHAYVHAYALVLVSRARACPPRELYGTSIVANMNAAEISKFQNAPSEIRKMNCCRTPKRIVAVKFQIATNVRVDQNPEVRAQWGFPADTEQLLGHPVLL